MLINLTNHPISNWSKEEMEAAKEYGEIHEMPFPKISANLSEIEVERMADNYVKKVMKHENPVVLVQGEFTFTFMLVTKLKAANIECIAACSEKSSCRMAV